jgi:hypothetical protein
MLSAGGEDAGSPLLSAEPALVCSRLAVWATDAVITKGVLAGNGMRGVEEPPGHGRRPVPRVVCQLAVLLAFVGLPGGLATAAGGGRAVRRAADDHGVRYPRRAVATSSSPTASPYPKAVLADHPVAYYRLDDTGVQTTSDSTGNGSDGTYVNGTGLGAAGALLSDSDTSVTAAGAGVIFNQSGDQLPTGNSPRTVEAWVHYVCCSGSFDLMRYGDVAGGHGFEVSIADSATSIAVTADGVAVSAGAVGDFAHGWHLIDVSYDGTNAVIYEDGQVIGGGTLGPTATAIPGQGLRMAANANGMGLDEVAIYPSALSRARIGAHWTTGASNAGTPCVSTPTSPYAHAILADTPVGYYRLDELSAHAGDRAVYDSSPGCHNGAYENAPTSTSGALPGDPDAAVAGGGHGTVLMQSGNQLPAGSAFRTVEAWVDYVCCSSAFDLMRYGDVAGGHGFEVSIADSATSIGVAAGGTFVSAATVGDFAHGWHLVDVTYGGNTGAVEIYQDGQVIGGGALGTTGTVIPGQGLQAGANTDGMGLDELAIYPSALSSQQVRTHYEARYLKPPVLLTVSLAGMGSGAVTGSPSGISCPGACSHKYGSGTQVRLNATAAAGSFFSGWSGACTGTGGCTVMMSAARKVIATFRLHPPDTKVTSSSISRRHRSATFGFRAIGVASGFQCALVRGSEQPEFSRCNSPKSYRQLKSGSYRFLVRGFNARGRDPTPAMRSFRI